MPLTRPIVDAIERGRRDLTLPELAVLLGVLDMDLGGLLGGAQPVAISEFVAVKPDSLLDQLVPGRDPSWTFATVGSTGRLVWRQALSGYSVPDVGDTEKKAARKLGVTPETVAEAAEALYGRSLADERDERVKRRAPADTTPRTLQALRGRVTRTLLDELQPTLRRKKKG